MSEKKRAWLYYHGASTEQDLTQLKPWTADLFEYAERMEYEIAGITFSNRNDVRSSLSRLEFFTRAAKDGIMDVLLMRDCSVSNENTEKASKFIGRLNGLGVEVVWTSKES